MYWMILNSLLSKWDHDFHWCLAYRAGYTSFRNVGHLVTELLQLVRVPILAVRKSTQCLYKRPVVTHALIMHVHAITVIVGFWVMLKMPTVGLPNSSRPRMYKFIRSSAWAYTWYPLVEDQYEHLQINYYACSDSLKAECGLNSHKGKLILVG